MKKIYFSFLSLLTVFTVNAQLTQANNAPAAGDMYEMYQCDSVAPGSAGANAVWNFASINTHSSIVRSFTAQAVTTTTYPAAGIAVASGGNDISYLASSSASLAYYGGYIGVGLVAGNLTYTAPAIQATYPMALNTTASAATNGTIYVSSLGQSGSFLGNSSVLADAMGTISLPGGITYTNTMRVRSSQVMTITATIATATVIQVNYNYYASGIKAPVFSISTSTAIVASLLGTSATSQTFVTRNKNAVSTPVSIVENEAENASFSVFPNPSNTSVNFATNHPEAKLITVYDITGKQVEKQSLNDGKVKVDVSSLNKGLYLYTISTGDNRTLKSGKITVSH